MDQFSPEMEAYLPAPQFKYTPPQRQIDFAQLIASGAHPVEALVFSGIVPEHTAANTKKSVLWKMANNLLETEAIQERVDFFKVLHRQSMDVTADRIRQEGAAIAFSDFAQCYHKEARRVKQGDEWVELPPGTPITNPHDIPRHVRAAIKEFVIDQHGIVKIKFHDKLKALQMLGDLDNLFEEAYKAKAPIVQISLDSTNVNVNNTTENSTKGGPLTETYEYDGVDRDLSSMEEGDLPPWA